jgi:hypothetical protein
MLHKTPLYPATICLRWPKIRPQSSLHFTQALVFTNLRCRYFTVQLCTLCIVHTTEYVCLHKIAVFLIATFWFMQRYLIFEMCHINTKKYKNINKNTVTPLLLILSRCAVAVYPIILILASKEPKEVVRNEDDNYFSHL